MSIYITVSSIYNIGKRDGQRLQIEHIRQLPLQQANDSINPLNYPNNGRSTENETGVAVPETDGRPQKKKSPNGNLPRNKRNNERK